MKIPTEDFTDETLVIDDTLGDDVRVGDWGDGQLVMEVDKMADEVTDMEVYKVTDMKIPIDVTLAIGDTYRDDVRSGRQVGRHLELIQVMPPVSQIFY